MARLASSICSAIHTIEPFLGVISDRCTWRFRRRAFVVVGQSCIVVGVAGFWLTDATHAYSTLLLSYVVFHVGCMVGWVPYIAVIPELPPHQRALGASVIAFTCGACEYIGSMLGVAVGQRWIGTGPTYILMLVLNVLNILLGCLAMGDSPGWLTAERPAPPLSAEDSGRSCAAIARSRLCGGPGQLKAMCADFLSAFKTSPAFARMFLLGFIGSLNPFGTFYFYWFQDVFQPNFNVFGYHITGDTQTAIATMSACGQIFRLALSLPGGWIDTRYLGNFRRRKALLLALRVVGLPMGAVYLFRIPFTVVFCFSAYDWIVGNLTGPAGSAFSADCLPVDR
jgi:hypothetical protein